MKKVKHYMCKDVIYVRPKDSIFKVAKTLSKHRISGAPVVDKKKVLGIVSISDIIKFMSLKLASSEIVPHEPQSLSMLLLNAVKMGKDYIDFKKELARISKTKIKDIMSLNVVFVNPDANLFEAATMMEKRDVNRLLVINEKGKLVGIVTREDMLEALVD